MFAEVLTDSAVGAAAARRNVAVAERKNESFMLDFKQGRQVVDGNVMS